MASHHVTIAKASFAAACLRPDVVKVSREDLSTFHALLEAAISKCSPSNIQKCKQWIFVNIVPSLQKTGALGKYLASFSKYIAVDGDLKSDTNNQRVTSQGRRRLHILYIVNDLLHHSVYHSSDSVLRRHVAEGIQPYLLDLLQNTVSESKKKVRKRVDDLIGIWEQEQYFDRSFHAEVRRAVSNKDTSAVLVTSSRGKAVPVKDLPYIMPATHGDLSTPYYDLPAANLMPHIAPNEAVPMRPERIRALQLTAGPADEGLVNALKDFLADVKKIDNPFASLEDAGIVADIDELGQLSYHNENDEIVGDTYYGWSRAFCQRMKKRGQDTTDHNDRRSRSYSSSRSRSPAKRARYNSSDGRSRSRSRSQPRRVHSPSYSPEPGISVSMQDRRHHEQPKHTAHLTAPPRDLNAHLPQFPIPLPSLRSNNVPIPPPRPAHWTGPWPPPPPPPFLGLGGFPNMPFPPPPPPPPF